MRTRNKDYSFPVISLGSFANDVPPLGTTNSINGDVDNDIQRINTEETNNSQKSPLIQLGEELTIKKQMQVILKKIEKTKKKNLPDHLKIAVIDQLTKHYTNLLLMDDDDDDNENNSDEDEYENNHESNNLSKDKFHKVISSPINAKSKQKTSSSMEKLNDQLNSLNLEYIPILSQSKKSNLQLQNGIQPGVLDLYCAPELKSLTPDSIGKYLEERETYEKRIRNSNSISIRVRDTIDKYLLKELVNKFNKTYPDMAENCETIDDEYLLEFIRSLLKSSPLENSIINLDLLFKDLRMDNKVNLENAIIMFFADANRIACKNGLNLQLENKALCKALIGRIYPPGLKELAMDRN